MYARLDAYSTVWYCKTKYRAPQTFPGELVRKQANRVRLKARSYGYALCTGSCICTKHTKGSYQHVADGSSKLEG